MPVSRVISGAISQLGVCIAAAPVVVDLAVAQVNGEVQQGPTPPDGRWAESAESAESAEWQGAMEGGNCPGIEEYSG